MTKRALVGIETTRQKLGERLEIGEKSGELTVVTRHGQPKGVLVPMEWFRRASEALGEPTDL